MAHLQYMPGDQRLVDQIVYELKSKGIFDQFRKDCIADVDTKPAYQNLRQRVESTVSTFLARQKWTPDLNKNQLREKLRKHILDGNYLEQGVERIVDQVVNPKVASVFIPEVEELVYNYLGIPRKKTITETSNGKIEPNDLLPTDLEAVSPGSVKSNDGKDEAMDTSVKTEEKMDVDDVKTELKQEKIEPEKDKEESVLSAVSDLTSHDSNSLDNVREVRDIPLPAEIKPENIPPPDTSPPTIELSKIELPKHSDIPLPDDAPEKNDKDFFKTVSDSDDSSSDSSLRRNMSPITPIRNFDDENSCDAQQAFDTITEIKDKKDKELNDFIFSVESKVQENSVDGTKSVEKKTEQKLAYQFENQVNINSFNTPMYDDSSNSNNLQIDYESDANSKINSEFKPPPESESSDTRKDEKDDKKKGKSSHRSRDSHRSSSSKDKRSDSKHSSSRDRKDSKHDKKSKDKDDNDKKSSHRERSKDRNDKKDRDSSKNRHRSSSSSHKTSSHKDSKSRSSSSSHKHSSRHSDERKDKDRSKDHKSRDSKSSSSSSHRSEKDRKSSSSKSKDDKERDKKKKETDDHYSLSGRNNNGRRSTDRDSNDGTSSSKGSNNHSSSKTESKKGKSSGKSENNSSNSDSTSPSNTVATDQADFQNKAIRIETHLETPVTQSPIRFMPEVVLKKPKFASNMEEARKLMKMRKFIDEEQRRMNQEAALLLEFQANVRPSLSQVYSSIPGPELEFACMNNDNNEVTMETEVNEAQHDLEHFEENNTIVTVDETFDETSVINECSKEDTMLEESIENISTETQACLKETKTPLETVIKEPIEHSLKDEKSLLTVENNNSDEVENRIINTVFEVGVTIEPFSEDEDTSSVSENQEKNFVNMDILNDIIGVPKEEHEDTSELKYFTKGEKADAEMEREEFSDFLNSYIKDINTDNKLFLICCEPNIEEAFNEIKNDFGGFEIISYHKNGHSKKRLPKARSIDFTNNEITLPVKRSPSVSREMFSPVKSDCSFELASDYDEKLKDMANNTSRQQIMEIILGGAVESSPSKMPTIDICDDNDIEIERATKRKLSEIDSSDNNNRQILTANKIQKISFADQISSTTDESEVITNNHKNNIVRSKYLQKARRVGLPKPKRASVTNSPSSDKSIENYEQNTIINTQFNGKISRTPRNHVQRYDTSDLYKPKLHYLKRNNIS